MTAYNIRTEVRFMYSVLLVAKYIIKYCNEKNYSVSNLKLQKLLYFAHWSTISSIKALSGGLIRPSRLVLIYGMFELP